MIGQTVAEQLDQPAFHWLHAVHAAQRALWAGDTDRAEQLATRALETGTEGAELDASIFFGGQLMHVSWQRGTLPDLVTLIEQAIADNPGLPAFIPALAIAHGEVGRTDDARRLLDEFAATGFDLPLDELWITGMALWAQVAIECSDATHAGPLLDQLAPWADQVSCSLSPIEGPVSHYLGGLATVLGRYDDADAYLAQSVSMNERTDAKFFGAQTDLGWGRMLAEHDRPGDREHARDLLTKAHTTAVADGYARVARRATAALEDLD